MTSSNIQTYTFLQYTIIAGKNRQGNDEILRESDPDDIWFHISKSPSGHVILKNPEQTPINKIPKQVLKRCACICKASTRTSEKNCEIIYTQLKNITLTDILGQVTITNTSTKTFRL